MRAIIAKMRRIEIITDHNRHTYFIQTSNSHWHLRLCHCSPHTACILTPMIKPNNIEPCNMKLHNSYQEFDMQGVKTFEQDKSMIG